MGQGRPNGHGRQLFPPAGLAIDGQTVRFSVQDGTQGDADWAANGVIVDPSGPMDDAPAAVTPIPALSQWGLMLLGLLAAELGLRQVRQSLSALGSKDQLQP